MLVRYPLFNLLNQAMKTHRACRLVSQFALFLLLAVTVPGCATTRTEPASAEYKGPIEEPKKKTTFWSVLGFIVTPIANFLSSKDEK